MAITHELIYWDDTGDDRVFCSKIQCPFMGTTHDGFSICSVGPIPRLASDNTCIIHKTLEISIWEYDEDDDKKDEKDPDSN